MTGEPPTVRDVEVTREPPFIHVEERAERKREHALMAGSMALATAVAVLVLPPVAVLPAFISGYALCNYLTFDDQYEVSA